MVVVFVVVFVVVIHVPGVVVIRGPGVVVGGRYQAGEESKRPPIIIFISRSYPTIHSFHAYHTYQT